MFAIAFALVIIITALILMMKPKFIYNIVDSIPIKKKKRRKSKTKRIVIEVGIRQESVPIQGLNDDEIGQNIIGNDQINSDDLVKDSSDSISDEFVLVKPRTIRVVGTSKPKLRPRETKPITELTKKQRQNQKKAQKLRDVKEQQQELQENRLRLHRQEMEAQKLKSLIKPKVIKSDRVCPCFWPICNCHFEYYRICFLLLVRS